MSDDRSNVVGLHDGCFQAPGTTNDDVVAKLRDWLAQAERGEIDGIALAASRPSAHVVYDYALGRTTRRFE